MVTEETKIFIWGLKGCLPCILVSINSMTVLTILLLTAVQIYYFVFFWNLHYRKKPNQRSLKV